MNSFAIATLMCAIINFGFSIFIYIKRQRNLITKTFALMCISIGVWSLGLFLQVTATEKTWGLFWTRLLYVGVIFIPIFFLHSILVLLDLHKEKRKILIFCYTFALLFLPFTFTKLFIKDVVPKVTFQYWEVPGPIYPFIFIFFIACVTYALYLMFRMYRRVSAFKQEQIKYFLIGGIIGFTGGITIFLPVFNIPLYPFGMYLVLLYPIIIAFAIVKHRLMDIRVAITRTGVFIAVYTVVLGLPFAVAIRLKEWLIAVAGAQWWMLPLGLMGLLATVGPFIYIFLERKAEDKLLREQRRYQQTLKQASLGMTRIRDLRRLLDLITHIITKTVRIAYAAIYLYNSENDEYVLQVSRDKGRVPVAKLTPDNPLISLITLKREPLIYEEVKRQMQDLNDPVYRLLEENMRLLTASVVIPSFLENKFMGFIVLGEKVSGQLYTVEDLNVFQVLASQAALAIENAQFYDETKRMQEQVAQAEKMATVGTMADGLSHQINNRFYALSLIAGDTIDTIKMTDTSKCTPEMKKMIDEVNYALNRIQANVMQGGEVVKGILKYTRKGEDIFEPLTLDQIIDGTLDMVQYKVKLSEIDIVRNYFKDIPKIKGNLVQLEEVFFNFIDNAYDATVERKTILKEEGYKGKIDLFAYLKDDKLEIMIQDNGMGIKEHDAKKIFTPFFTTKISARKGTGLGLYVINRIITDTHKGKIAFESEYKVGTRFIIELPIAQ